MEKLFRFNELTQDSLVQFRPLVTKFSWDDFLKLSQWQLNQIPDLLVGQSFERDGLPLGIVMGRLLINPRDRDQRKIFCLYRFIVDNEAFNSPADYQSLLMQFLDQFSVDYIYGLSQKALLSELERAISRGFLTREALFKVYDIERPFNGGLKGQFIEDKPHPFLDHQWYSVVTRQKMASNFLKWRFLDHPLRTYQYFSVCGCLLVFKKILSDKEVNVGTFILLDIFSPTLDGDLFCSSNHWVNSIDGLQSYRLIVPESLIPFQERVELVSIDFEAFQIASRQADRSLAVALWECDFF